MESVEVPLAEDPETLEVLASSCVSLPLAKSKSSVSEGVPAGVQVVLPGHGDPGAGCGEIQTMVCLSCGHVWEGKKSCMLRTCPHCWRKWAQREAGIAGVRLWAGSCMVSKSRPGRVGWRLMHVVVSFQDQGEDMALLRERARLIARRHGVLGGCSIYHPFRKDSDNQYVPDGYVHFHLLGLCHGDILPGGLPSDQGAVFKVIPDARRGDFRGLLRAREVRVLVHYLLTHCGIVKGRQALTWWGVLGYNNLHNKTLDDFSQGALTRAKSPRSRCPLCGSDEVQALSVWDMRDIEYARFSMEGPPLCVPVPSSTLDDFPG